MTWCTGALRWRSERGRERQRCQSVCVARGKYKYTIKPKIRVSWDRRSDKKSGLDNRAPHEGLNKTPHDRAFRAAPNEGSHVGRGSAQHRALLYEGRS